MPLLEQHQAYFSARAEVLVGEGRVSIEMIFPGRIREEQRTRVVAAALVIWHKARNTRVFPLILRTN